MSQALARAEFAATRAVNCAGRGWARPEEGEMRVGPRPVVPVALATPHPSSSSSPDESMLVETLVPQLDLRRGGEVGA